MKKLLWTLSKYFFKFDSYTDININFFVSNFPYSIIEFILIIFL